MSSSDPIVIDARFNGPLASANGGWVAGSLARRIGGAAATVSLRAPPPLGVPLTVRPLAGGAVALYHDLALLAEAAPAALELELPIPPDLDQAQAAGTAARMRAAARGSNWPYAHCFGCGYARRDGLAIVPGPVGDDGLVAAAWTPGDAEGLAAPDGTVRAEAVWAALDCPAGIAWSHRIGGMASMMTVRMTASIDRPLRAQQRYVVAGWPISREGRKLHAGTAIFDAQGNALARSRQLWLLPRE